VKRFIIILSTFILIATVAILRPVPIPDDLSECLEETITISNIVHAENQDITIFQANGSRMFYINHGMDYGLDSLINEERLRGAQLKVLYPRYWTPLDWNNNHKHATSIIHGSDTLFNEIALVRTKTNH
jgi:hypothetical protein